jgi:hypothetical protein
VRLLLLLLMLVLRHSDQWKLQTCTLLLLLLQALGCCS